MLCILRDETDPFFNIAAEEYVLKNFSEDVFMLWIDGESLIIGKHQNPFEEISGHVFVDNTIPVIRRISGGGTVYHDQGNINFTFVLNGEPGKLVDYPRFLNPVIHALKQLGIEAYPGPRNEIMANGFKISGNAQHVFKNRVLHHGTLLFSTNLGKLNGLLSQSDGYISKSLKSVPGNVTNISQLITEQEIIGNFKEKLFNLISQQFSPVIRYSFQNSDKQKIQELADEKYKTWKWNFGYTSDFKIGKTIEYNNQSIDIELNISQGIIKSIKFKQEIELKMQKIFSELSGIRYYPDDILRFSEEHRLAEIFTPGRNKSLISLLFN